MLSLLLALLASPPFTSVSDVLTICDTPKLTRACGLYVRGFMDAVRAHEEIATRARPTIERDMEVLVPTIVCMPTIVDLNAVRMGIVDKLKYENSVQPARVPVLGALAKMFPCK